MTNINLKILKDLVSIKSISPDHQECQRAIDLIMKVIKSKNIPITIDTINEFPFLLAGNPKSSIAFISHIDVIDGDINIFKLRRNNNRLIGRGVLDMKGPLLVALKTFVQLWQEGKHDFLFCVTTDEEIGGFNGVSSLVQTHLKNIKGAIILDSVSGENLVCNQKAPFHVKITSTGKAAHGSRPWEGDNAINHLTDCVNKIIRKLNGNSKTKTTAIVSIIKGGTSLNSVPSQAEAILDIRIVRKTELLKIINIIDGITLENNCIWEKIDEPIFFETLSTSSFIHKWNDAFSKTHGKLPQTDIESGASDARFLSHILNIPIVITSAVGGGAHSDDEWVSLPSLLKLKETLLTFCKML